MVGENPVDLGGDYCPSPLGIASENVAEVPASWLVPVISRRTIQSTGPGGGLRKAKFISALVSSHHHRPTHLKELALLPKQDPLLPTHRAVTSGPFLCNFLCWEYFPLFPKPAPVSSPSRSLCPYSHPSPHHPQTLRFPCVIWLIRLFLSF